MFSKKKSMKMTAHLSPGQGSGTVYVGMGLDLWLNSPAAREIYKQADDFLRWPLSQLCFFGPEKELSRTANSQLADFVTSVAYSRAMKEPKPYNPGMIFPQADFYGGHSVGLYAACVESGVLSFLEALGIVRVRGEAMEKCCERYPGNMIVLVKPDIKKIMQLAQELGLGGNFNSQTQILLSGPNKALGLAEKIITNDRLAKIYPKDKFKVGGAFHSKCMEDAKEAIAEYIAPISFRNPDFGIITNSLLEPRLMTTGDEVKQEIVDHVDQMLYWHQGMELLLMRGVKTCVESGSGQVLTNNLKRSFGRRLKAIPLSVALKKSFFIFTMLNRKKKISVSMQNNTAS